MKHIWRQHEKNIYLPKTKPNIINIPIYKYIKITGLGNPNSPVFQECIPALYTLSYALRMAPKKNIAIPGYNEYTVYPLEAYWGLTNEGIQKQLAGESIVNLKDYFTFDVMIRQPNFLTDDLFEQFKESSYKKTKNENILKAKLVTMEEGLVCQMMHIGDYDSEPGSFEQMDQYCKENGYIRLEKNHREIYISDPRKVEPCKLKTVLRFKVKKI